MAGFQRELERFLAEARRAGALDEGTAQGLEAFARGGYRPRSASLRLASALGWLGGLAIALGVILLVAANWEEVPRGVKIAGMLALLCGSHALGFRLARAAPRTAQVLHFLGGCLLLAGIGLIGQVYQHDLEPAEAMLLWLAGVAPLALLLDSGPLALLAAIASLAWAHLQGAESGSALAMREAASAHLCLEVGAGIAFAGLGALLRARLPGVARLLRAAGAGLLLATLFAFGFYRHFAGAESGPGSPALPLGALAAGAIGLVLGSGALCQDAPALRARLIVLLVLAVALGGTALAADSGWIGRGPAWGIVRFGAEVRYDAIEWVVSIGAWCLWFALALWCVAFGVRTRRNAWVNAGVLAFALGIVTNFLDVIGTLAGTGLVYVLGGAVLLATAWASERWRRRLGARMEEPR